MWTKPSGEHAMRDALDLYWSVWQWRIKSSARAFSRISFGPSNAILEWHRLSIT
jgi:hypothetical protein